MSALLTYLQPTSRQPSKSSYSPDTYAFGNETASSLLPSGSSTKAPK